MVNLELLAAIPNKTLLIILMVVLIVFLVLMTILAIVFIIALRKRAPVVKVLMAPTEAGDIEVPQPEDEPVTELEPEPVPEIVEDETAVVEAPVVVIEPETEFVEGREQRIRYDRSMQAKIAQLSDESKEWYSQIKNELLAYNKIKARMSWKRESFRFGRQAVARFAVRGKTLCLLLAIDPARFEDTKYKVENVGDVTSAADTPCLLRVKSLRKVKYAKEIIAMVMKELETDKNPDYLAEDFFVPYEDTVNLMNRGLIKRVLSDSSQIFEIRKVDGEAVTEETQTADGAENADKLN